MDTDITPQNEFSLERSGLHRTADNKYRAYLSRQQGQYYQAAAYTSTSSGANVYHQQQQQQQSGHNNGNHNNQLNAYPNQQTLFYQQQQRLSSTQQVTGYHQQQQQQQQFVVARENHQTLPHAQYTQEQLVLQQQFTHNNPTSSTFIDPYLQQPQQESVQQSYAPYSPHSLNFDYGNGHVAAPVPHSIDRSLCLPSYHPPIPRPLALAPFALGDNQLYPESEGGEDFEQIIRSISHEVGPVLDGPATTTTTTTTRKAIEYQSNSNVPQIVNQSEISCGTKQLDVGTALDVIVAISKPEPPVAVPADLIDELTTTRSVSSSTITTMATTTTTTLASVHVDTFPARPESVDATVKFSPDQIRWGRRSLSVVNFVKQKSQTKRGYDRLYEGINNTMRMYEEVSVVDAIGGHTDESLLAVLNVYVAWLEEVLKYKRKAVRPAIKFLSTAIAMPFVLLYNKDRDFGVNSVRDDLFRFLVASVKGPPPVGTSLDVIYHRYLKIANREAEGYMEVSAEEYSGLGSSYITPNSPSYSVAESEYGSMIERYNQYDDGASSADEHDTRSVSSSRLPPRPLPSTFRENCVRRQADVEDEHAPPVKTRRAHDVLQPLATTPVGGSEPSRHLGSEFSVTTARRKRQASVSSLPLQTPTPPVPTPLKLVVPVSGTEEFVFKEPTVPANITMDRIKRYLLPHSRNALPKDAKEFFFFWNSITKEAGNMQPDMINPTWFVGAVSHALKCRSNEYSQTFRSFMNDILDVSRGKFLDRLGLYIEKLASVDESLVASELPLEWSNCWSSYTSDIAGVFYKEIHNADVLDVLLVHIFVGVWALHDPFINMFKKGDIGDMQTALERAFNENAFLIPVSFWRRKRLFEKLVSVNENKINLAVYFSSDVAISRP